MTTNGIRVNLRMRFTCAVYRDIAEKETKKGKAVKKGTIGDILMKDLERGGWGHSRVATPRPPRLMAGKIKKSGVLRRSQWRHLKSLMISLWISLFGNCIPPIVP